MANELIDPFDSAAPAAASAPPPPPSSQIIDPFDTMENLTPASSAVINALPRRPTDPNRLVLTQQPPGTVPFDPTAGSQDQVGGGSAPVTSVLKASMVPATSAENMQKKIKIFSRDMNIPESRFFVDKEGEINWVDFSGASHRVVPSVEAGSWKDPLDLTQRFGARVGNEFGPMLPAAVGGTVSMVAGPAAGAAAAAATDAGRQYVGNWLAGENSPGSNLDYGNMGWQALGTGVAEVGTQVGSALVGRALNRNPYNLPEGEIRMLQGALPTAKARAEALEKHGIWATPYELTDLPFLKRLETTTSKRAGGKEIMENFYDLRSERNFPAGIQNLLKKISPEGVPDVGLQRLQNGAENTLQYLKNNQVNAGLANGWGEAIASGARVDARPVIAEINKILPHVNGEIQGQLNKLLNNLYDTARGGAPGTGSLVTDFEKIHNIRLDLEATLKKIEGGPAEEAGRMTTYLKPVQTKLQGALETAHPAYKKGNAAFELSGRDQQELRDGIITLLSQDPKVNAAAGRTLFDADPKVVAKARELFELAGQGEHWAAGTRAFLENALRSSAKGNTGANFAQKVAPFETHVDALKTALPPGEGETVGHIIDAAKASGRVPHPTKRAEVENVRLDQTMIPGSTLGETIKLGANPFGWTRELGNNIVVRAMDDRAVTMAENLTGRNYGPYNLADRLAGRKMPAPRYRVDGTDQFAPSTAQVLRNLEDTTATFGGWQRHAFERALAGGISGTAAKMREEGLLGREDATEPTAEDLLLPQSGLLGPRRARAR